MSRFNFEYPIAFLLIVLFLVCAKFCKERTLAIYFPHISALKLGHKFSKSDLLKWLGIALAISALASPVIEQKYEPSKKAGRDIVMVIDSSGSMRSFGFDPNNPMKRKFDVVKEVVGDFIRKRHSDRIGIITFADFAFVAAPLTFEKEFLQKIIAMQRLGIAGKRTAINDALVQSLRLLEKSKAKNKVIILLTDGIENASRIDAQSLQKLLATFKGVKLYTIGIGRAGEYDAEYLKRLAQIGGGAFFEARNADRLQAIYHKIDQLEKSKIEDKKIVQKEYLYYYPLLGAIILLFGYLYIRSKG